MNREKGEIHMATKAKRKARVYYRVPITLTPAEDGGFVVTSPVIPELMTDGDTIEEIFHNLQDAMIAVIELYEDLGKPLPKEVEVIAKGKKVQLEAFVQGAA